MNEVTIFIPVSRNTYLDRLFHSLEVLECDRTKVSLLVLVDGDTKLFVETRNYVEMSKFRERLCIPYKAKDKLRQFDLLARRLRISDIHNESKKYIVDCKYVLGLEDDTICPPTTLKRLLQHYSMYPYAGFIGGVELGRWGIPYVGAWKVDDIYEPTKIESLPLGKGLQEVDSSGFYCYLTTRDNYMLHKYEPFDNNGLGPDVNFGIALRREGLSNYVDWEIKCIHKNKDKDVTFGNTTPRIVTMVKKDTSWRQSNNPTEV